MHSLVVLTGPSCAGKSPLVKAVQNMYPQVIRPFHSVVLYNSRQPRPGEKDGKDYHFRSRDKIADLGQDERFRVMEVRGDLQAVDIEEMKQQSRRTDLLYEGNPHVAKLIVEAARDLDLCVRSVFLSPVTTEELNELNASRHLSAPEVITEMMRRKLLRRTRAQKADLSLADLNTVERRARAAYEEMRMAEFFDTLLPNHDGEDSENWDAFGIPLGDARKALGVFVRILKGNQPQEPGSRE